MSEGDGELVAAEWEKNFGLCLCFGDFIKKFCGGELGGLIF